MGQGEATPSKATETQVFPAWTPWLNIFLDTLAGKTFRLEFPAWWRNVDKRYPQKPCVRWAPTIVIDPVMGPYKWSYNPTYNWKGPTLPLEVLGSGRLWPISGPRSHASKKRLEPENHLFWKEIIWNKLIYIFGFKMLIFRGVCRDAHPTFHLIRLCNWTKWRACRNFVQGQPLRTTFPLNSLG